MDTITIDGLTFRVSVKHDEGMGAPWKEHDGHGIVSEWTARGKAPGERVLAHDGASYRYYDYQGTLARAAKDGWGIAPDEAAGLTKRQITARAVDSDYERMRAWCADEWDWVYVCVTLLDTDGAPTKERESCGGIESDAGEYLDEIARELAGEIIARVGTKDALCVRIRPEVAA